MKKNVHAGGRPPVIRPAGFYRAILTQYETMTIREIAAANGVSRATVSRWLRKAREGAAYGE